VIATRRTPRGGAGTRRTQFHHRDPLEKKFMLSVAATAGRSRKALLEEMAKCIVLCANCHLIHHWEERQRKGSG
jgi:hypothetical protein